MHHHPRTDRRTARTGSLARAAAPGLALLLAGLAPAPAPAASPEHCAPSVDLDPLQLLRQVSLDVRGRVPTYEEYEWVRGAEDPKAAAEGLIDEMLRSDDYFSTIREYHQALLWGTLDRSLLQSMFAAQRGLSPNGSGNWRLGNMRKQYRGDNIDCLNQPQTQFDAAGRPVPIETYANPVCTGGTCRREGYVMVEPYWAPGTEIKVCAYDAQQAEVGKSGLACSLYHTNDELCGCGPGLVHCGPDNAGVENQAVRDALAEEPARIFQWVVQEGRSYLEAFTTDTTFMNGPVAHYYRHNTGTTALTLGSAVAYDPIAGTVVLFGGYTGAGPSAAYFFFGDEQGGVLCEDAAARPALGAVLSCVVPHCDPTVNLYEILHIVDGDTLVDIWPIEGRGRSF